MNIDPKYAQDLSIQGYQPKTMIEGVEMVYGEYHHDDGGNFAEIARVNERGEIEGFKTPFMVRQMSMSLLVSGAIKAYHIHQNQDDIWFVPPPERLLVNLHDLRQGSPTFDAHMRFVMGAGKHMLVRIPRGVAHGVANIYNRDMCMFYATDAQFNRENPDEGRLPWDAFGTECWELKKG